MSIQFPVEFLVYRRHVCVIAPLVQFPHRHRPSAFASVEHASMSSGGAILSRRED